MSSISAISSRSRDDASCPPNSKDDRDNCDIKLDKGQLKMAGLFGREHEAKEEITGSGKNNSRFDLCGCKDGRVVLKLVGCKGPVLETTTFRWK